MIGAIDDNPNCVSIRVERIYTCHPSSALRGPHDTREVIRSIIGSIDRNIQALSRSSEACRLLITVPGVGPITALAVAAAIENPARFRRSRDSLRQAFVGKGFSRTANGRRTRT